MENVNKKSDSPTKRL